CRRCRHSRDFDGGQLVDHRRCRRGGCDLVVVTTTPQIDDIGIVRVLKDADEVSLAQALTVAAEQPARGEACLAGTDRCATVGVHRASYQIECLFATETEPAGADLVADCSVGCYLSGFTACRQFSYCRSSRRRPWSASFAIAVTASATSTSATRALRGLCFVARRDARGWSRNRFLTGGKPLTRTRRTDFELTVLELGESQQAAVCRLGDEARELGH